MKNNFFLLLMVCFILQGWPGFAQETTDTTKIFRIETKDGNTYTGTIVAEDANALILRTENMGELRIPLADISMKKELQQAKKVGDTYWLPNPQSSRYFWAPNGYGLAKGEAYYQNIWVLYNQISYGFTDNFSLGAGMVPLFLIAGASTPIWLVPKFSIPLKKDAFNLGTGAFLGTVIGEETGIFGLVYGTATIGNRDKNFSFGLAYGFVKDEWAKVPLFNLSGMSRLSSKSYFVSENYFISIDGEFGAVFSVGGRSIIRRVGLDYSLWIPVATGMDTFLALPFLGVTIPLNNDGK